mmetsp:Transcript_24372/g.56170  ORF Transcript_24372/g.56170 Transcript_24372/m.56170 type:complete len:240 (-) Transcript_24372:131-850(-)
MMEPQLEEGYVPIALRHGERELRHMAHLGLSPNVRRTSCTSEPPVQFMEHKTSLPCSPVETPGCHSAPLASLAAAEVAVLRALSNSNKSKKCAECDTDASTSPGSPLASRQASRKSGSGGDTSPESLWPALETKQTFDVESLTHTYTALSDSKECTQATAVLGSAFVANPWRALRFGIFVTMLVLTSVLLLRHFDWSDTTLLLFLATVAFASVELTLSYRGSSLCASNPAERDEALLQS